MVMSSNTARTLITNALKTACTAKHGALTIHAWQERPGDWLWEIKSNPRPDGYEDENAELEQDWLQAFDRELTGNWTYTFSW